MTADRSAARDHWDRVHTKGDVDAARPDDPIVAAALRHFGDVRGMRLLDLGCGMGQFSLFFADRGAQVTALDTSTVAIDRLRAYCDRYSIVGVEPTVGDAFGIDRLGPFDRVFGSMILHHLEPFERFADVLREALTPGGRAFFYENNASVPLLLWCRDHLVGHFGIPKHGDDDESPLEPREIDALRARFSVTTVYPEMLFARLGSAYLLHHRAERFSAWLDDRLYRVRRLRRFSYRQCVLLTRGS